MQHLHLIVRAEVRHPLFTPQCARNFLARAVATAGMRIISGPYAVLGVVPGNEGVSATAILDFSSASLHEWPDAKPHPLIHFDLYTCGKHPDIAAFEKLFQMLDPVRFDARILDRDAYLL